MTLRIHFLGPPHFQLNEDTFVLRARPKTLPLLALLLLRRQTPLSRETAAFSLWPDIPEGQARTNLRRHLHHLGEALPPAPADRPWLLNTPQSVQWNPASDFWLDVAEFERLGADPDPRRLTEAVALYRGDLLEGVDEEDWLYAERERLRNQYLVCLERLIQHTHRRRDYPEAIDYARRLRSYEPFRESILRQLLILRYESGDRAGALRDYESFVRQIRTELRADPMPETTALFHAIARSEALPEAARGVGERLSERGLPELQQAPLPFVGREQEMELLRARWHRAAQGEGGLVLVSGEAGIGKSRIASELARTVGAEGGRVLNGTTATGEPVPYQAVLVALRAAVPLLATLTLDPIRMAVLAQLLPELPARLRQDSESLPPLSRLEPERERLRLFEALAICLEGLARPRPLLLVVEDVHWASAATIALLEFLALRTSGQRLLLLATYRPEEVERAHPLREVRRRLQTANRLSHVSLGPLTAAAVHALVEGKTLLIPAAGLADYVFARSEGNPFFAGETLRDLLESGVMPAEGTEPPARDGPAPSTGVRAVIGNRLARLPPAANSLAGVAAVCGMAFDPELLREISGWGEAQVLDAIETLLDHHLLREAGGGDFAYTFTHHLIQETIYAGSPPAERQRRHRRAGRVLEDLYPARQDELSTAIASHLERGGEARRAADWYLRAARYARSLYADGEALQLLNRGLAAAAEPSLRFDLLAAREEILSRSGEPAAQEADLAEMESLSQALHDRERQCQSLHRRILLHRARGEREREAAAVAALRAQAGDRPHWQAEGLQAQGAYFMLLGQYAEARQQLEQALQIRQAADELAGQIACICLLAEVDLQQGHFAGAESRLEQARTLAARRADRSLLLRTLHTAARTAFARQDFAQAERLARQSLELAQEVGDRAGEADAHLQLATAHARLFHVQAAHTHYDQAARRYSALAKPQGQAATLINLGTLHTNLGNYAEAGQTLREADRLFTQLDDLRGQTVCALNLAVVAHYQGHYLEARAAAQHGLELSTQMDSRPLQAVAFIALGAAERELGNLPQAVVHLQAGLALRRALGQTADLCHDLVDLVVTCLRLGDLAAARHAAEEMLGLYNAAPGGILQPQAVLWAASQAYLAFGDPDRAQDLLAQARSALDSKAAAIPEPNARQAFLNLPFNRELLAASAL